MLFTCSNGLVNEYLLNMSEVLGSDPPPEFFSLQICSSVIVKQELGHICVHFVIFTRTNSLRSSVKQWIEVHERLVAMKAQQDFKNTFQHHIASYLAQTNGINTLIVNWRYLLCIGYIRASKCFKKWWGHYRPWKKVVPIANQICIII